MKFLVGIGSMCLGAALAGPVVFAQTTPPRAHAAAGVQPVESPYLGVGGKEIDADSAKALKLKEERGAEITSVDPDSAAGKAGMKEGDVVLEYNGQKVEGWEHLKRLVHETPIHREVKIGIWRNGAEQTLTAMLGSRREYQVDIGNGTMVFPPMGAMPPTPPAAPMPLELPQFRTMAVNLSLGITGESLGQESQLAEFFGVKEGVLVRSVTRNSAADKAGLKAGDVITKIEDTAISTPQQISSALRTARNKGTLNVVVVRNKKEVTLTVTPDAGGMMRGGLWFDSDPNSGWFVMQGGDSENVLKRLFLNDGSKPSKIAWQ